MSRWSYQNYIAHAQLFANARARMSSREQCNALDIIIRMAADMYEEDAPVSFDRQWFLDRSRCGFR